MAAGTVNAPGKAGGGEDPQVGNLNLLTTENKSSAVLAINEVNKTAKEANTDAVNALLAVNEAANNAAKAISAVGVLDDLPTENKSSLVAAINELTESGALGAKSDPGLVISPNSFSDLKSGSTHTAAVTYSGDGTFIANSSNNSVATVSYANNVLTIKAVGSGSCTIEYVLAEGSKHAGATGSISVSVAGTLEQCSWAQIQAFGAAGTGANYFDIGDTKTITLNGTVGTLGLSNFACKVFIIEFNYRGDKGIYFQGFKTTSGVDIVLVDSKYNSQSTNGTKYFNMNHNNASNTGGWLQCPLRSDILGSTNKNNPTANTLMAALPADLRNALAAWTIWTANMGDGANTDNVITSTTDYLPLLAEFEVNGWQCFANRYEKDKQAQMAYYANGNSARKYLYNNTNTLANWWMRSPSINPSYYFIYKSEQYTGTCAPTTSNGLAPAFRVA